MIKVLFTGLWACVVALLASYFAAQWKADVKPTKADAPLVGLEFRKLKPITVPMIADGAVQGYVLARLSFTADAGAIKRLSVNPDPFVEDEVFREIYVNGKVEFGKLAKYNLDHIVDQIKTNANQRLGADFVHDLLVEEINYVDRKSIQG